MLSRRHALCAMIGAGIGLGSVDAIVAEKPKWTHIVANNNTVYVNGVKIRGMRKNNIICDEYCWVSPEVFNAVTKGFKAVR